MNVTDLIMELAKMPPDLEVIYQLGETEQGFKMIVVQDLGVITADNDIDFVMLNAGELEELNDDDDDEKI